MPHVKHARSTESRIPVDYAAAWIKNTKTLLIKIALYVIIHVRLVKHFLSVLYAIQPYLEPFHP